MTIISSEHYTLLIIIFITSFLAYRWFLASVLSGSRRLHSSIGSQSQVDERPKGFIYRRLERKIRLAGLSVQPKGFFIGVLWLQLIGGVMIWKVTGLWYLALAGMAGLWAMLEIGLSFYLKNREAVLEIQLEQALSTLINLLAGGRGLLQAVETLSTQSSPPLSTELKHVMAGYYAGIPLVTGFRHMFERVQLESLFYLIQALDVHRLTGGSLVHLLHQLELSLKEKRTLAQELLAKTSEARWTAVILALLPIALGGYLIAAQPVMMAPLFNTTLGRVSLLAGIAMWITGTVIAAWLVDLGRLN